MRVQDLLNEFAPLQPTDDELDQQLDQNSETELDAEPQAQQPAVQPTSIEKPTASQPLQNPVATKPVVAPSAQSSTSDFGSNIKTLLSINQSMKDKDPKKAILDRFLSTVGSYFKDFTASKIAETISFEKNLAKGNMASMFSANETAINEFVEYVKKLNPNAGDNLESMAAEFVRTFSQNKNIIKANLSAIAGIELNTKGQIARLDADIEANAQAFAKKFNVKSIWARNLVGMFSIAIERDDRKKFLDLCLAGKAMSIENMIKNKQGSIDTVVAMDQPEIAKVFKHIKETLLDISLSTGQRGATGPFEAMLAIMGGAEKPKNDEGGDVKIGGKKFEVKSTSISVSTSSMGSGSGTPGWLDAGPKGEVGASKLREIANTWVKQNVPSLDSNKKFNDVWKTADFIESGLANLNASLQYFEATKPGSSKKFLAYCMLTFFPNCKVKEWDFARAITRMLKQIEAGNARGVAREQGILGLIEYIKGKGNDGFIFFNSSFQEYRVIDGLEGLLEAIELDTQESNIHFITPMSMGNRPKASPAIYYGPEPTSPKAKEYIAKVNSDPKRMALIAANKEAKKQKRVAKSVLETIDKLLSHRMPLFQGRF
jgi:hypothetical protein